MDTKVQEEDLLVQERALVDPPGNAPAVVDALPAAPPMLPPRQISAAPTADVQQGLPAPAQRRRFYVSVRTKFLLTFSFSVAWAAFSIYLSLPWMHDLARYIGYPLAILIISGIAIVPGFMNAFMVGALLLDRRPARKPLALPYPPLTILIAAYKEEGSILGTLESVEKQNYPGKLQVIVINDGSPDSTAELVRAAQKQYPWLELLDLQKNAGKANALNQGLKRARHHLVLTVDADSYLYKDALTHLVERYISDPANTAAVAGCVLVRNSRENWLCKAQEWDYFHGIACIKRIQSLFQGTLVAQGAFSLYTKTVLQEVGGWPECVGEDIVMTWAMLKRGYRVGFCEDACAFTNVPATMSQFIRQRQRWSRGMIEAFKQHPEILLQPRISTFFIYWNLLFPLLDLIFTLVFLPGLVLAMFGHYWIAGPMTLVLLPLAALINILMLSIGRKMFDENGLRVRRNIGGMLVYTLGYSVLLQPACLLGYLSEFFKLKKTWGTK
jgi:biofilm PGA synthesis N-glycosyltransferase PgaC